MVPKITYALFISLLSVAPASAMPLRITPFVGSAGNWSCGPVTLDQSNVVGFLSLPRDEQTVDAKVLYRKGGASGRLEVRLMKADAEALRGEISALLDRSRPAPIRFEARGAGTGKCEVVQITG